MALEWQMAMQWIQSTEIDEIKKQSLAKIDDLLEFAQSLRDGVILCLVANALKAGCVKDISKFNNVNRHEFLCNKNIRAFLRACSEVFKLEEKKLFKVKDLYEATNFEAVIKTLSCLSKTHEAKNICKLVPFPPEDYKTHYHDNDEDIYGTLPDILESKQPDYYNYDEEEEDIYDHVEVSEKIYDDIVQCTKQSKALLANGNKALLTDKRSYVVNEVIETEENYLNALKVMIEEYIQPLKGHMSAADKDNIFMNTEQIFYFHMNFNRDLTTRQHSTTVKLNFQAFVNNKERFLIYALYCTGLQDAQQHVIELIKNNGFRDQVEKCNKAAKRKFPLQEQLVVPFQRILKYPLLLRDLNKQTPENHEDKKIIEKAWDAMDDVARFINEYKRDAEIVKVLAQIESSVKYDMHGQGGKPNQYGRHVKDGELQVKFDNSNERKVKRFAFLFENSMLMCKQRGETYDVKEIFDLQKFKIGDVPPVGKSKFSHGWSMQAHSSDGVCEFKNCTVFAKTQQDKITWVSELSKCIEAVTLSEFAGKLDKHQFELTTFESPQTCGVCKKLLRGQISQGYKCINSDCQLNAHKDCLKQCPRCCIAPIRPLNAKPTIHLKPRNAQNKYSATSPTGKRPTSPPAVSSEKYSKFHWFAGTLSREEAGTILQSHPDGAFLIRESPNSPGLAISIKYANDFKHIKIGRNSSRYFLTETKQFPSIEDLISYYKMNSLGASFPTLPTKLTKGVSKQAKRVMIAKFAWQARNEQEISFQAGQKVNVINDEGNWWLGECNGKEGFFPNNYVE